MVQPARSEMGSRLRYYLFAFLAFVLATEVVVDLQSGGRQRPALLPTAPHLHADALPGLLAPTKCHRHPCRNTCLPAATWCRRTLCAARRHLHAAGDRPWSHSFQ